MNRIIFVIVFLVITFTLFGQKKREQKTESTGGTQQKEIPQQAINLSSNADSTQYILGAYLGQYMQSNGLTVTNPVLFIKGMDDVLSGKPLLIPPDSIPKRMSEYLTVAAVERNKLLEKQLFDAVKGQPGVGTLPNGVCYVIAKAGTGLRPQPSDSINIHVKGYLPDGLMFEDTYTRNTPMKVTAVNLIPGLRESLLIMPAGSVWRIYIPSALAYGESGVPGIIPPFSALVFDIELLSIKK